MFQKTRLRLSLLNSLVFIILLGAIGGILYFYFSARTYKGVDQELLAKAKIIERDGRHIPSYGPKDWIDKLGKKNDIDSRTPVYDVVEAFVWTKNGLVLSDSTRENKLYVDGIVSEPKKLAEIYEIEKGGQTFRTLAFSTSNDREKYTIQLIRNFTTEKEMLHTLLLVLIVCCVIGGITAILAGFFLAGRALIPITNAWKQQQEFVADASHELRTPLAVIQTRTDLILHEPFKTIEEKAVDISVIAKESRRLSRLVSHLLLLARTDSNQLEIEKKEFSLSNLLAELFEHYETFANYQNKHLQIKFPPNITFFGDRERIHQLFVILLDNALRYTEEDGDILLSCVDMTHSFVITIKDNGIGIRKENVPHIFDRFYRVDTSRTGEEGTGLGLAIAKWIIDKHYGKVSVESTFREGTIFEIVFPKNQKDK